MWKRLKVVVPGFGTGTALAVTCALPIVSNPAVWEQPNPPPRSTALLVLFGPVAGPFAEPLAFIDFSVARMFAWAAVLLPLIALHPCYPRWQTGIVSGLAIAFWFFLGFANTYYTV